MLADALYMLGHMIDHGSDTPVESFVVHSLYVEQVEPSYEGRASSVLKTSLSNVPYA
jgi:hypothetical protein